MPKNKLILEKIIERKNGKNEDEDEDDNYDYDDFNNDSDIDSDKELENDFAAGKIKPGLYGIVPFKRTIEQINDKEGLMKKLNEIKIFNDNWLERLDFVCKVDELQNDNDDDENNNNIIDIIENNDFKNESIFQQQAKITVNNCINLLKKKFNIKNIKRPDDYFAEMLKTDEQMKKILENLNKNEEIIKNKEKFLKQKQLKKYGKKLQQEIQLKRQKEKKELLNKIQQYKKGKLNSLDFLETSTSSLSTTKSTNNNNNNNKNKNKKITKKQRYKEAKYGYGGRKKRSKYNSSQSSADMSGFSVRKHGGQKIKNKRPGKSRRKKLRNKS